MNKDRKNNSVTFNLLDDFELELLNHAERKSPRTNKKRNFSKYVKNLIYEDLMRERQQGKISYVNNTGVVKSTPSPLAHNLEIQMNHVEALVPEVKVENNDSPSKEKINTFLL